MYYLLIISAALAPGEDHPAGGPAGVHQVQGAAQQAYPALALSATYMCVYIYICIYIYIHTYIHMYIHIVIHICICAFVCVYLCIYIYIYTYTQKETCKLA